MWTYQGTVSVCCSRDILLLLRRSWDFRGKLVYVFSHPIVFQVLHSRPWLPLLLSLEAAPPAWLSRPS